VMKFSGSSGVRMEFFVVSGDLHFLYLDQNRRLRCRKLISVESGEETSQDRSKLGFIFVPLQAMMFIARFIAGLVTITSLTIDILLCPFRGHSNNTTLFWQFSDLLVIFF
jgi:hypothetical protein